MVYAPGLSVRSIATAQFESSLSLHKLGQAGWVHSVKAALDGSGSQCGPGSNSTCNALEFLRAKVVKLEQVAHEPACALRNHHAVRLGNALQARGKVRRLADDGLLAEKRRTRSDRLRPPNPVAMPTRVWSAACGLSAVTAVTNSSPWASS